MAFNVTPGATLGISIRFRSYSHLMKPKGTLIRIVYMREDTAVDGISQETGKVTDSKVSPSVNHTTTKASAPLALPRGAKHLTLPI